MTPSHLKQGSRADSVPASRSAGLLVSGVGLGPGPRLLRPELAAQTRGAVQAPMFEVDPFWPKPLPNHWNLGAAVGVWVDAQDHIWMIHRGNNAGHPQRPGNEAALQRDLLRDRAAGPGVRPGGQPAPALGARTERSVDGPGARHPRRPQEQRVAGRRRRSRFPDPEVHDGRQVRDAGREERRAPPSPGPPARSTIPTAWTWRASASRRRSSSIRRPTRPMCPTDTSITASSCWMPRPASSNACGARTATNRTIRRCSGPLNPHRGRANAAQPADRGAAHDPNAPPQQQFRNPVHCVVISKDDLVYVCDRQGDRLQVFTKDGKFVKEKLIEPKTMNAGSVWDMALSSDPQQTFLYVADGENCAHSHPAAGYARDPDGVRRGRPPARSVAWRAQHRDRFAGQHLYDRDLRRKAHPEVHLQGREAGDEAVSGHALAGVREVAQPCVG